jgi:hypothetical protein
LNILIYSGSIFFIIVVPDIYNLKQYIIIFILLFKSLVRLEFIFILLFSDFFISTFLFYSILLFIINDFIIKKRPVSIYNLKN